MYLKIVKKTAKEIFSICKKPIVSSSLIYGANENYWVPGKKKFSLVMNDFQSDRLKLLSKFVDQTCVASINDLGAGDGALDSALAEKYPGIKIKCFDRSHISVSQLRKSGMEAHVLDIEESFDDIPPADLMIGFEILEHLRCPEQVLVSLLNKSKVGLAFSVPNTGYYTHRLRLFLGYFPLQWHSHPGEHLRFWTLKDMRFWMTQLDIDSSCKISIIPYQGHPFLGYFFPNLFHEGIFVFIQKKVPR